MMPALGSVLSMYFAPKYFARAAHWALPLAATAMLVAFFLPIFARDLVSLGAVLLIVGAVVGLLDISTNLRIAALESLHRASLMNLNHDEADIGEPSDVCRSIYRPPPFPHRGCCSLRAPT